MTYFFPIFRNNYFRMKSYNWRMPSSGMWRRVDLLWTDVSEERIASIFRAEKFTCCSHLLTLVFRTRIFLFWRWWYVPPKRRFTHDLRGATSQKTAFFIVTAAKTSNFTKSCNCHIYGGQFDIMRRWGIKFILRVLKFYWKINEYDIQIWFFWNTRIRAILNDQMFCYSKSTRILTSS
jgi:hypothetical protein